MLSLISRGKIQDPAVQAEFEHLAARLRGFLSQSFDVDGQLIVADPNFAIVPVGGILPFGGTSAPTGYLLCDGSQVSRVTYKPLFDVISTTYGVGDGSTTFNVPDLRQKFPLGKAASGTGATLGGTGGAIDHTHTVSGTTSSDGGHSHSVSSHQHSIGTDGTHGHSIPANSTVAEGSEGWRLLSPETDADGAHNHGGNTGSESPDTNFQGAHTHTLSGTSGTGNPPFLTVNYIVFAGV